MPQYQKGNVPFVDYDPCTSPTEKGKGPRCKRRPIPGGTVCLYHGGAAKQVQAAAQMRLATQKIQKDAEAVLAHEGIEALEDPLQELGKLAAGSKALMEALGARVNALQDLESYNAINTPTIKAEVQMYERAMDRTHRLLDSLVKHGYAERQIQIQESEAMLVAGVLRRVIAGLGLSPEQQKNAQSLLAAEFRALAPRPIPAAG
jgi:hypothetical protein